MNQHDIHLNIENQLIGPVLNISQRDTDPDEPKNLCTYTAFGSNIGSYLKWQPDLFGSGCAFNAESARAAALGEYVERYSANFIPNDLEWASWEELTQRGESATVPGELFPFSIAQDVVHSGQFTLPSPNIELEWERMTGTRSEILVPADLVYLNYYRSRPQRQRTYPVILPGIAAGASFECALRSAVTEVLERDATSLWWHARTPAIRVNLPEAFFEAMGDYDRDRFASDGLLLRTYWAGRKYYVAAFVLRDITNGTIQVGFACRSSLSEALYKAASESWQLRRLTEAVRDSNSWAWRQRNGTSTPLPLLSKPPTKISELTQLVHNIQYYLDTTRVKRVYQIISENIENAITLDLDNERSVDTKLSISELEESEGLDMFWCDVTTPDMAAMGYTVVRAYSPQACPNLPAAFPPLANNRLKDELTKTARQLQMEPLPHA